MYKDFTEMPVWDHAMEIAVAVFGLSEGLPRNEDYALTSQIRRSASAISTNIAEGFGRGDNKEKSQFYKIARGSAFETKNHLIYGTKVKYFPVENAELVIKDIENLIHQLNKLIKTLESKSQPQP